MSDLYRVTLKHKYFKFEKNKTYYVVQETKEKAKSFIEEILKNNDYEITNISFLGEGMSFGNILFSPKKQK